MADFKNPYAEEDPFVKIHFECLSCGGKLWEYGIQQQMVCEDCRAVFPSQDIFDTQV
jgi:hypothetical protein